MSRPRSESRPLRSCVQCGAKDEKGRLVRIAGRPGRGHEPDPSGRLPGRGIYLCRTESCVGGFLRRIGSPKGRARWGMKPPDAAFAARLKGMVREEENP